MIVVFGSINLDLIFPVAALPAPGETLLAPAARFEPGGKGANQAMAAARDGAEVVFAGAVGQDSIAGVALSGLAGGCVDLTRVTRVAAPTGCAAITVDPAGRNHIVVASGANLMARADQVEPALLTPGTLLVMQMETLAQETEALILRASAAGARCILNLAPAAPLAEAALRALDVLVVNESEASWLADWLGCTPSALAISKTLGVTVVRSLGDKGLEAEGAWGECRLPAHPVSVVDSSAAGDCLVGVLASGLDRGLSWPQALGRANLAAGLCCTRAGTQTALPTRNEIDSAGQLNNDAVTA